MASKRAELGTKAAQAGSQSKRAPALDATRLASDTVSVNPATDSDGSLWTFRVDASSLEPGIHTHVCEVFVAADVLNNRRLSTSADRAGFSGGSLVYVSGAQVVTEGTIRRRPLALQ